MGGYDWMKLFWNERGEAGQAGAQGGQGGEGATGGAQGGQGGEGQSAQDVIAKLSPETIAAIEQATGKSAAEAVEKALADRKAAGDDGGIKQEGGAPEEVPSWLANLVKPVLDSANAANFQAQAAADATEFYSTNPGAGRYRKEIEQQFQEFAKGGRPTFRSDIYRWMTGEGGVLQERVVADRAAASKQAEQAAAAALTAGGGASRTVEPPKPVEDMSGQELEDFMADKVF